MYTFTFQVKLPSAMQLQNAEEFFNQFNTLANDLIGETEREFSEPMPVSTYVLDENNDPVA